MRGSLARLTLFAIKFPPKGIDETFAPPNVYTLHPTLDDRSAPSLYLVSVISAVSGSVEK